MSLPRCSIDCKSSFVFYPALTSTPLLGSLIVCFVCPTFYWYSMNRFFTAVLLLFTLSTIVPSCQAGIYENVTEVCHHVTNKKALSDDRCVAQYRTLIREPGGISVQNHLAHGDAIGFCNDTEVCHGLCKDYSEQNFFIGNCLMYPPTIIDVDRCCCAKTTTLVSMCGPNTECVNDACECLAGYSNGDPYDPTNGCY